MGGGGRKLPRGGSSSDLVVTVEAEPLGNWGQTLARVQSEVAPAAGGLFFSQADCVGAREGPGGRGPSGFTAYWACAGEQSDGPASLAWEEKGGRWKGSGQLHKKGGEEAKGCSRFHGLPQGQPS